MKDFMGIVDIIRSEWRKCDYDHRPFLPSEGIPDRGKWASEDMRRNYAAFKYTVAMALAPGSIVEIGVGYAVAAHAFLSAQPKAYYIGYDSGAMNPKSIEMASDLLSKYDHAKVDCVEVSCLTSLPVCDLCHVDGSHDFNHAYYDTSLALRAAKWVLVDDCHDSQVAAAVMQAVYCWRPGDVNWCFFDDSYGGDILIHTGRQG